MLRLETKDCLNRQQQGIWEFLNQLEVLMKESGRMRDAKPKWKDKNDSTPALQDWLFILVLGA